MKNLPLLIFFILSIGVNAQTKELKQAVKKGPKNEVYYATYDVPQKMDKIKSWCEDNGFHILKTKTSEIERFGDYVKGVTRVEFMEKNAYYAYQSRLRNQEAERRRIAAQKEKESDVETIAILGAATIALVGVLGAAAEMVGGSSDTYSPQINSNISKTLAGYEVLSGKCYISTFVDNYTNISILDGGDAVTGANVDKTSYSAKYETRYSTKTTNDPFSDSSGELIGLILNDYFPIFVTVRYRLLGESAFKVLKVKINEPNRRYEIHLK